VPNIVAIDAVKKDAVYYGLPEDASIIVPKYTLSLKDFGRLWLKERRTYRNIMHCMTCMAVLLFMLSENF
jgi:hypothetical protein